MSFTKMNKYLLYILILSIPTNLFGQTDSVRLKLIEGVSESIQKFYINDKSAKVINDSIYKRALNGYYDTIIGLDDFLWQLTIDIRKLSGQNHFDVVAESSSVNEVYSDRNWFHKLKYSSIVNKFRNKRHLKRYIRNIAKENFHFGRIEVFPGNIGYLEIKNFSTRASRSYYKRRNLKSVMRELKKSSSIIIDLRDNQGGYNHQLEYFMSYFFQDSEDYLYTKVEFAQMDLDGWNRDSIRKTNCFKSKRKQNSFYNSIYVLTSKWTFSCGDIAAYLLKTKSNAIIIGEKTAGTGLALRGGGSLIPMIDVYIPSGLLIDTLNKYSFDTSFVRPDIKICSDSALVVAYEMATQKLGDFSLSSNEKEYMDTALYNPFLQIGDFGRVKLYSQSKELYMKYDYRSREKLKRIGDNKFKSDSFISIKLIGSDIDNNLSIELTSLNGLIERYKKNYRQ